MGVNIILELGENQHPEWDYIRQGDDRDFVRLFNVEMECEEHPKSGGYVYGQEVNRYSGMFRPKNIGQLRGKIEKQKWRHKERYFHFCDLLEKDKNCWIYISW